MVCCLGKNARKRNLRRKSVILCKDNQRIVCGQTGPRSLAQGGTRMGVYTVVALSPHGTQNAISCRSILVNLMFPCQDSVSREIVLGWGFTMIPWYFLIGTPHPFVAQSQK